MWQILLAFETSGQNATIIVWGHLTIGKKNKIKTRWECNKMPALILNGCNEICLLLMTFFSMNVSMSSVWIPTWRKSSGQRKFASQYPLCRHFAILVANWVDNITTGSHFHCLVFECLFELHAPTMPPILPQHLGIWEPALPFLPFSIDSSRTEQNFRQEYGCLWTTQQNL